MAATPTPIDPRRLHNFELPQFWGDNASSSSSSTVNRRSRSYKPPVAPTAPPPPPSSKSPEVLRRKGKGAHKPKTWPNPPESHQQSHKYNSPPAAAAAAGEEDDPRLCQLRTPRRRRRLIKKSALGGEADKTRVTDPRGDDVKSRVSNPLPDPAAPIPAERVGSSGEISKEEKEKGKGKMVMEEEMLEGPKEEVVVKEKKKKLIITIPLTKQEIEQDILALTGAYPSKRPRKRDKSVQAQLNAVFPGLYLSSITPDTYKVAGPSRKKRKRY